MFVESLTADDILVMNVMHNPVWLTECLFIDNPKTFESLKYFSDDDYFKLRMYQVPMMDFGYMLFQDEDMSDYDYFQLRREAGSCYMYCGRGIGKSLIGLMLDLLLDTIHNYRDWVTLVSSFDQDHVMALLDPYIEILTEHPFMRMFLRSTRDIHRKNQSVEVVTGYVHKVIGINWALSGGAPGSAFERHHPQKHLSDEHQYEPEEVTKRRGGSKSDFGVIERFAGITAFGDEDPAGRIFNDPEKKPVVVNLPKTVSPYFTEKQREEDIALYNGEEDPGFLIHILAEIVKSLRGLWNMDKVDASMRTASGNYRAEVKTYEVSDKNFDMFENFIIMERPANASAVLMAADPGDAVTEIVFIFKYDVPDGPMYRYEYNITLHRLIPSQQKEIFEFLVRKMEPEYVVNDTTEIGGRDIIFHLRSVFEDNDRFIECNKNHNVITGYERDEATKEYKLDDKGNKIPIKANMKDWAVYYAQKVFYSGRIKCLRDRKLYKQFSAIKSSKKAGSHKAAYVSSIGVDHLHAAFIVFGYLAFLIETGGVEESSGPEQPIGLSFSM